MNRPYVKSLPALLALLFASVAVPTHQAAAQGFSSVSSAPPAAAPTAPTDTPPAVQDIAAPASAAAPAAAPSAQLASLGFNSGSGATPDLPGAVPPSMGGRAGSTGAFEQADKVLVDKGERKLYLLRQGRVVAEYPVKLGLNPYGHKQQEGDFRTPEGRYDLVRRNPRSEFFLSIQVSYPNREDAAWAKENGWQPGGAIMIHGQPNVPRRPADFYANRDWTDGCIALSNADMVDVWLRTTVGIPIEIRP